MTQPTGERIASLETEVASVKATVGEVKGTAEGSRLIVQEIAVQVARVEVGLAAGKANTEHLREDMRDGFQRVEAAVDGGRKRAKRNTAGWTAIGGGLVAIVAGAVEMARRLL